MFGKSVTVKDVFTLHFLSTTESKNEMGFRGSFKQEMDHQGSKIKCNLKRPTGRLNFRYKSTAIVQRISESLRGRLRLRGVNTLTPELVALLPRESRAEKRQWLSGTRRWLEQRVAMALPLCSIERGDDPPHERELGPIRLVRELHRHAPDVEHILGGRLQVSAGLGVRGLARICGDHGWSCGESMEASLFKAKKLTGVTGMNCDCRRTSGF